MFGFSVVSESFSDIGIIKVFEGNCFRTKLQSVSIVCFRASSLIFDRCSAPISRIIRMGETSLFVLRCRR